MNKEEKVKAIKVFIRNRMRECKLNRNKGYDVGNKQLAEEWAHVYNELGQVLKEIESM